MNLITIFILALVMVVLTTVARVTERQYKNKTSIMLYSVEIFLFVYVLSGEGWKFALAFTLAKLIGMTFVLFKINKKKAYAETITVVAKTEKYHNIFVDVLRELEYRYAIRRNIETKDLYDREVVIVCRSMERSKTVKGLIPKNSFTASYIANESRFV